MASTTATETQSTIPDTQVLDAIAKYDVLDESGKAVPFGSLYTGEAAQRRQLIIFIRHYYCGQCETYVRTLSERHSPEKLASLEPPAEIIIVGCGSPDVVAEYKKRTQAKYRIYSDPTRQIYFKLGFIENLGMGDKKPEYLPHSTLQSVVSSAWTALTAGRHVLSSGNFSQNGGELLFEAGQLKWFHAMKNTRDHAEINELERLLKL